MALLELAWIINRYLLMLIFLLITASEILILDRIGFVDGVLLIDCFSILDDTQLLA